MTGGAGGMGVARWPTTQAVLGAGVQGLMGAASLCRCIPRSSELEEDASPAWVHRWETNQGTATDGLRFAIWSGLADLEYWVCSLPPGHWALVRHLTRAPRWHAHVGRLLQPDATAHLADVPDLQFHVEVEDKQRKVLLPRPSYEAVGEFLTALLPGRCAEVPGNPADPRTHPRWLSEADVKALFERDHRVPAWLGDLWTVALPGSFGGSVRSVVRQDAPGRSYSVDVVDVLLPAYALLSAVESGAVHRLLSPGGLRGWRMLEWSYAIHGRVVGENEVTPVFPGREPRRRAEKRNHQNVWGLYCRGRHFNSWRGSARRVIADMARELLLSWSYEIEEPVIRDLIEALEALRTASAFRTSASSLTT